MWLPCRCACAHVQPARMRRGICLCTLHMRHSRQRLWCQGSVVRACSVFKTLFKCADVQRLTNWLASCPTLMPRHAEMQATAVWPDNTNLLTLDMYSQGGTCKCSLELLTSGIVQCARSVVEMLIKCAGVQRCTMFALHSCPAMLDCRRQQRGQA